MITLQLDQQVLNNIILVLNVTCRNFLKSAEFKINDHHRFICPDHDILSPDVSVDNPELMNGIKRGCDVLNHGLVDILRGKLLSLTPSDSNIWGNVLQCVR